MAGVMRDHRIQAPKRCPLCRKLVIKADFDGKNAKYARLQGAARKKVPGMRWQHIDCRDLKKSRHGTAASEVAGS